MLATKRVSTFKKPPPAALTREVRLCFVWVENEPVVDICGLDEETSAQIIACMHTAHVMLYERHPEAFFPGCDSDTDPEGSQPPTLKRTVSSKDLNDALHGERDAAAASKRRKAAAKTLTSISTD